MDDEELTKWGKDKLKVIRKEDGALVLGTQSNSDAIKSPIFETIKEQCPTQVFFPNTKASEKDFVGGDGFGLTKREYLSVKEEMGEKTRRALFKQGDDSVIVDLSLPFDKEMSVISGTKANIIDFRLSLKEEDSYGVQAAA